MDPTWQQIEGTPTPVEPTAFVRDLEARVGWHRQVRGLPALKPLDSLTEAARSHGQRMRDLGFVAHADPHDQSDPMTRVQRSGTASWALVSENIAAGQWEAEQVMRGWLDSPHHRANIERVVVDSLGTAVVVGGEHRTYTVQLYAKSSPGIRL